MLIVMAGLPGAGKSTLAEDIAAARGCTLLSVDPIEAALWRAGVDREQPTGLAAYVVVEALAAEQLALGHDVVVDAVNAVEPARAQWRHLAERTATALRFVEVQCSDVREHRRRLSSRTRNLDGFREPSWQSVEERRASFAEWTDRRLVLDSMRSRESNARAALAYVVEIDQTLQ